MIVWLVCCLLWSHEWETQRPRSTFGLATMNMSYNIVIRDNQVYVIKIKSIFISTSGFGNTICKYFSEKCVNLKCKYSRVFTFWGKGEGGGLKPPRASSLLQLNTLQMIVVYAYPLFL